MSQRRSGKRKAVRAAREFGHAHTPHLKELAASLRRPSRAFTYWQAAFFPGGIFPCAPAAFKGQIFSRQLLTRRHQLLVLLCFRVPRRVGLCLRLYRFSRCTVFNLHWRLGNLFILSEQLQLVQTLGFGPKTVPVCPVYQQSAC